MSDVKAKQQLRGWLNRKGYVAYPSEMILGGRFCDVVGYHLGKFYAFEVKQKGDHIAKALKQLADYSRGVHFCVVVADEIGKRQIQKFVDKGFGVWQREACVYHELVKPEQVEFFAPAVENTRRKFQRHCGARILGKEQMMIEIFLEE